MKPRATAVAPASSGTEADHVGICWHGSETFWPMKPFPCGINKKENTPSSKVSMSPPAAKPTWFQQERKGDCSMAPISGDLPPHCALPGQKSSHIRVYLGCSQICPVTAAETRAAACNGNDPCFFFPATDYSTWRRLQLKSGNSYAEHQALRSDLLHVRADKITKLRHS